MIMKNMDGAENIVCRIHWFRRLWIYNYAHAKAMIGFPYEHQCENIVATVGFERFTVRPVATTGQFRHKAHGHPGSEF